MIIQVTTIGFKNNYWIQNFDVPDDKMWRYFRLPYLAIRNTKIQVMQYKIIRLVFPCGKILKRWKINDKDLCEYCDAESTEDIVHYFCECENIQYFWCTFNRWWSTHCTECIIENDKDVLLGKQCGKCHFVQFNYVILLAKWFIYTGKKAKRDIFFLDYLIFLKKNLDVEKYIYNRQDKYAKFLDLWGEIYDDLL
jgi:hypothetical protein